MGKGLNKTDNNEGDLQKSLQTYPSIIRIHEQKNDQCLYIPEEGGLVNLSLMNRIEYIEKNIISIRDEDFLREEALKTSGFKSWEEAKAKGKQKEVLAELEKREQSVMNAVLKEGETVYVKHMKNGNFYAHEVINDPTGLKFLKSLHAMPPFPKGEITPIRAYDLNNICFRSLEIKAFHEKVTEMVVTHTRKLVNKQQN